MGPSDSPGNTIAFTARGRITQTTMLINKAKVRRIALDQAASTRRLADGTPRFTRVSKDFFINAESQLRTWITSQVHSLPSAGRTI